jgi:hypothetical protein
MSSGADACVVGGGAAFVAAAFAAGDGDAVGRAPLAPSCALTSPAHAPFDNSKSAHAANKIKFLTLSSFDL